MEPQAADTIIEKNGKILMLRRAFDPGKDKLDLPGGAIDPGETAEIAAVREAKEETGLDVQLDRKIGTFEVNYRGRIIIDTVFRARIVGGELSESDEGALEWVDPEKLTPEMCAFPDLHPKVLKIYLANAY